MLQIQSLDGDLADPDDVDGPRGEPSVPPPPVSVSPSQAPRPEYVQRLEEEQRKKAAEGALVSEAKEAREARRKQEAEGRARKRCVVRC